MLMLQHKAPHRPWAPDPITSKPTKTSILPEPETLFDDYTVRTDAAREASMTVAEHLHPHDLKLVPLGNLEPDQKQPWDTAYSPRNREFDQSNLAGDDRTRWNYQRYIKDYLRSVASIDDNLGRVLDYLDEVGLADNTVVIYTSDQGFFLGEHGWYDKRFMYEESLRTPLIVRWPGVVSVGSENIDMVLNLDLPETLLDIAGVTVPDAMQGRALTPLLQIEFGDDEPYRTPAQVRQAYVQLRAQAVDAEAVVRVDGQVVATGEGRLMTRTPFERFTVGADPQSRVDAYPGGTRFAGELRDIRLYWSRPDDALLGSWLSSEPQ